MGVFEILLIVFCSLLVLGVIVNSIINRKKGKTCCGDCSKCSSCRDR